MPDQVRGSPAKREKIVTTDHGRAANGQRWRRWRKAQFGRGVRASWVTGERPTRRWAGGRGRTAAAQGNRHQGNEPDLTESRPQRQRDCDEVRSQAK